MTTTTATHYFSLLLDEMVKRFLFSYPFIIFQGNVTAVCKRRISFILNDKEYEISFYVFLSKKNEIMNESDNYSKENFIYLQFCMTNSE
jgi:hypothetical protein